MPVQPWALDCAQTRRARRKGEPLTFIAASFASLYHVSILSSCNRKSRKIIKPRAAVQAARRLPARSATTAQHPLNQVCQKRSEARIASVAHTCVGSLTDWLVLPRADSAPLVLPRAELPREGTGSCLRGVAPLALGRRESRSGDTASSYGSIKPDIRTRVSSVHTP